MVENLNSRPDYLIHWVFDSEGTGGTSFRCYKVVEVAAADNIVDFDQRKVVVAMLAGSYHLTNSLDSLVPLFASIRARRPQHFDSLPTDKICDEW